MKTWMLSVKLKIYMPKIGLALEWYIYCGSERFKPQNETIHLLRTTLVYHPMPRDAPNDVDSRVCHVTDCNQPAASASGHPPVIISGIDVLNFDNTCGWNNSICFPVSNGWNECIRWATKRNNNAKLFGQGNFPPPSIWMQNDLRIAVRCNRLLLENRLKSQFDSFNIERA